MPSAGKVQSGTVRKWLKKPGEAVAKGDLVLELETDAGLIQIESPVAGKMGEIAVAEGRTAPVHAALAQIDAADGPVSAPAPAGAAAPQSQSQSQAPAKAAAKPAAATAGKVIPILMPKAGQSMEEGTINKWHVQPGATIKKGDVIFEIETDKANMDVEAPESGRLARIVLGEGKSITCLLPVAYIADSDADVDAFIASGGGPAPEATSATAPAAQTASAAAPARESAVFAPAVADNGRVKASPAARKIAKERGVDLSSVAAGSGPYGRILSTDLPLSAPARTASAPSAAAGTTRKRMSQMRKAIAKNLLQSKQTIPHFYVRLTVDAAPALAYYQARKAQYPCSINDVIVLACAKAVAEFPAFRSRIEGDEIVESASANIGIAVGMDEGLVVPVIIGAERHDLKTIGSESRRLATAARDGKIEGMGSGTFTITNLGMFGTEEFAAIINPPESAILAVGAAREAVVVKDGAMRAGKVMTMTLSSDHRIIDGVLAAKFLARLKELLEAPDKLN
jgi:pyruvate dehydrogenase E2 component (dihydrolipoamide acetyltransferase)